MTQLIDTATGELLSVEDAERRASYISTDLDLAADSFETAMNRMREAIRERDDIVLGYRSPGDYLSDRFGGKLARLGVDLRREVVRELTEAGLSTRAIAPVVDVSQRTVVNDQVSNIAHLTKPTPDVEDSGTTERQSNDTPAVAQPEGGSFPTATQVPASEQGAPEAAPARPPVTGIDGKVYNLPTKQPAAKPLRAVDESAWSEQDRAEELARNLAKHLSLLYALTNPDRRADFLTTWDAGTRDLRPLGADFVTPTHMRDLAAALNDFASEWETRND